MRDRLKGSALSRMLTVDNITLNDFVNCPLGKDLGLTCVEDLLTRYPDGTEEFEELLVYEGEENGVPEAPAPSWP